MKGGCQLRREGGEGCGGSVWKNCVAEWKAACAAGHVAGLPGSIESLEFHAHEIKQDRFRAFSYTELPRLPCQHCVSPGGNFRGREARELRMFARSTLDHGA